MEKFKKEADISSGDSNLFEKRKEVTKEVEHLKRNLTQQVCQQKNI